MIMMPVSDRGTYSSIFKSVLSSEIPFLVTFMEKWVPVPDFRTNHLLGDLNIYLLLNSLDTATNSLQISR